MLIVLICESDGDLAHHVMIMLCGETGDKPPVSPQSQSYPPKSKIHQKTSFTTPIKKFEFSKSGLKPNKRISNKSPFKNLEIRVQKFL